MVTHLVRGGGGVSKIPLAFSERQSGGQSATRRFVGGAFFVLEGGLALSTSYLLALLLAARQAKHESSLASASPPKADHRLRLVVLVPAHNEEGGIQGTLDSLASCCYPENARRTVVIADNCTDRTADRAREADVEVWERIEPTKRGKGFALAWALDRLQAGEDSFDAVVILDADCIASPNMLSAMDQRLRAGASAVQVNYVAGNPDASHASALRFGAFALMNTVRFLGKQRLGLSCGLGGTGMAFTRDLLNREPLTPTGLVEDGEYHMRLVLAGERAQFVEDASVSSALPTSLRGSPDQQARWEQGKLQLVRHWSPRLVFAGLSRRDVVCVHAGLEWLVPPQSLIAAGTGVSMIAGLLLGSKRLVVLSVATLGGHLTYVLVGLRMVRAPLQTYRALLMAPVLIVAKVTLYFRLLLGRGPASWVRTEREPQTTDRQTPDDPDLHRRESD
jgi:1,2-diacylglycerol 3-beta-glucosyltransferase